ncbi:MAG: hydratase [Gammaproteobacteria bacterium]
MTLNPFGDRVALAQGWRWLVCLCAFLPLPGYSAPPLSVDETVTRFLAARTLEASRADFSVDEAYQFQRPYVEALTTRLGKRQGYKVAMTSLASQRHFGLSEPLYGRLLKKMLLPSPARLPLDFGARGLIEADLLVRVNNGEINSAQSSDQLLRYIDAVIPFIELPDPLWSGQLTAGRLVAVNCGARYGVMAEPIPVSAHESWSQRLAEFQVELLDPKGEQIAIASGTNLLGHPLKVVWWLVRKLQSQGEQLEPGDLLSLGSLTQPLAPLAGRYQAVYRGLNATGPVTVAVEFYPPH